MGLINKEMLNSLLENVQDAKEKRIVAWKTAKGDDEINELLKDGWQPINKNPNTITVQKPGSLSGMDFEVIPVHVFVKYE